MGGIIIDYGTFDWEKNEKLRDVFNQHGPYAFNVKLRKEVYRNMGACLSPHNAYLQSLGLDTMVLRADRSCRNSMEIANYLQKQVKVVSTNYPGLESSAFNKISAKQFGHAPCSLLTFDLKSKQECFQFMNNLKIIRRATNLQDNKTLILHPASTIFAEYDKDTRDKLGVPDTMIRLSAGIEDINDLIQDIENALETL